MNILDHATKIGALISQCLWEVPALPTAAILISRAGGGVIGSSSMHVSIVDKLASLRQGIPVLRLDYRYPADNMPCVEDVTAAMDHLDQNYSIRKFVLVGWSLGGAPVFTVSGREKGRATVASRTAKTGGIRQLSPRHLLLLHGTGDRTLSWYCSQNLYELYGAKGHRQLKLFEGDDHALTLNALKAEELLCDFIVKCAGVKIDDNQEEKVIQKPWLDSKERVELMKKGGDLEGESVE